MPDTLLKIKRYDEALKWCEQVLKDRPNKIDIAQAISRKQDEIIREKSYYEGQQKSRELALGSVSNPSTPNQNQTHSRRERQQMKQKLLSLTLRRQSQRQMYKHPCRSLSPLSQQGPDLLLP